MIDISGRAMRAGTRGIAMLAAVAGFAVLPQIAHEGPAHAAGSGGAARHHQHRDRDGRPRVDLDIRAPHGKILPGRTYKWPYSVTNNGASPARNVTLATTPDRDLKVVTTPPRCRWHRAAVLVCRVGLIPRGQTRRGSITATVNPKAQAGKALSSPARLSWQSAPAADERTATAAFPPVAVSPATDLRVTSTAPDRVGSSDAPYRISVTNDGPVTAESVVVRAAVAPRRPERCADGSCAPQRLNIAACRSGCAADRLNTCGTGCARPDTPACDSGCGRPDACQNGSCGNPNCGCRPVRPPVEEAAPRPDRCGGQAPCGSCGPCSAAAPPVSERRPESCGASCGGVSCGGERGLCGGPVAGTGVADHPRDTAAPISIRHHRRCVTQGTGFVCPLGAIPPGRTRTLRLAVHGRRNASPHPFRCLSTVGSGTPDSNMRNNRAACHTRRARPLAAHAPAHTRRSAPASARRLPVTGGSFDALALWGLGLAGVGLALFGLGRLRRGEQG